MFSCGHAIFKASLTEVHRHDNSGSMFQEETSLCDGRRLIAPRSGIALAGRRCPNAVKPETAVLPFLFTLLQPTLNHPYITVIYRLQLLKCYRASGDLALAIVEYIIE